MVNYSNGKIYKIESIAGEGEIYIGSTTKQYLCQRMDEHRRAYRRWKEDKGNKTMSFDIFDTFGVENCQITLLETCSCETKDELTKREAYYIKTLNCVNKNIANRNQKQYYEDNKEKSKKYREDNKEKIQEYKQQYYEKHSEVKTTCDCGATVLKMRIQTHEKSKKHLKWLASEIDL